MILSSSEADQRRDEIGEIGVCGWKRRSSCSSLASWANYEDLKLNDTIISFSWMGAEVRDSPRR